MFDGILRIAPHRGAREFARGESILQLSNDLREPGRYTLPRRANSCARRWQFGQTPATHLGSSGPPSNQAPYVMSLQIRQAFFRCERSRSAAALTLAVGTSRHLKPNGSTAAGIPIFRVADYRVANRALWATRGASGVRSSRSPTRKGSSSGLSPRSCFASTS